MLRWWLSINLLRLLWFFKLFMLFFLFMLRFFWPRKAVPPTFRFFLLFILIFILFLILFFFLRLFFSFLLFVWRFSLYWHWLEFLLRNHLHLRLHLVRSNKLRLDGLGQRQWNLHWHILIDLGRRWLRKLLVGTLLWNHFNDFFFF